MADQFLYGQAGTLYFPVYAAGGTRFATNGDWTPGGSNAVLFKDGVSDGFPSGTVTYVGSKVWALPLSAAELSAKRLTVLVEEPGTIDDQMLTVDTVGDDSAFLPTIGPSLATLGTIAAEWVWDEVLTKTTHDVNNSAGRRLRFLEQWEPVLTGTFGTILSGLIVEFPSDNGTLNDTYRHCRIIPTSGRASGIPKGIQQYDGTAKRATISDPWAVGGEPQAGDEFAVTGWSGEHVDWMHGSAAQSFWELTDGTQFNYEINVAPTYNVNTNEFTVAAWLNRDNFTVNATSATFSLYAHDGTLVIATNGWNSGPTEVAALNTWFVQMDEGTMIRGGTGYILQAEVEFNGTQFIRNYGFGAFGTGTGA